MAIDAVRKFLEIAGEDQNLQEELGHALTSAADRFAALAHVATEHGYDASAADVRAAVEAEPLGADLGEEDVERVTPAPRDSGFRLIQVGESTLTTPSGPPVVQSYGAGTLLTRRR